MLSLIGCGLLGQMGTPYACRSGRRLSKGLPPEDVIIMTDASSLLSSTDRTSTGCPKTPLAIRDSLDFSLDVNLDHLI